jgi:hypothetical protein
MKNIKMMISLPLMAVLVALAIHGAGASGLFDFVVGPRGERPMFEEDILELYQYFSVGNEDFFMNALTEWRKNIIGSEKGLQIAYYYLKGLKVSEYYLRIFNVFLRDHL